MILERLINTFNIVQKRLLKLLRYRIKIRNQHAYTTINWYLFIFT